MLDDLVGDLVGHLEGRGNVGEEDSVLDGEGHHLQANGMQDLELICHCMSRAIDAPANRPLRTADCSRWRTLPSDGPLLTPQAHLAEDLAELGVEICGNEGSKLGENAPVSKAGVSVRSPSSDLPPITTS